MKRALKSFLKLAAAGIAAGLIGFFGMAAGDRLLSPSLPFVVPAAVRLDFGGQGVCSGVVISDHEILTAGHCLFFGDEPWQDSILVIGADNRTVAHGRAAGAIPKMDLGYVVGDFKAFPKAKAAIKHARFKPQRRYITCGYPMGQPTQVCDDFYVRGNNLTFKWGDGTLVYGQSGGPVIEAATGVVHGVNSHIYEREGWGVILGGIGVAPLTGIFSFYGIRRQ